MNGRGDLDIPLISLIITDFISIYNGKLHCFGVYSWITITDHKGNLWVSFARSRHLRSIFDTFQMVPVTYWTQSCIDSFIRELLGWIHKNRGASPRDPVWGSRVPPIEKYLQSVLTIYLPLLLSLLSISISPPLSHPA
jgi:hypothetical protein